MCSKCAGESIPYFRDAVISAWKPAEPPSADDPGGSPALWCVSLQPGPGNYEYGELEEDEVRTAIRHRLLDLTEEVSDYELQRLENINRNKAMLQSLGLVERAAQGEPPLCA